MSEPRNAPLLPMSALLAFLFLIALSCGVALAFDKSPSVKLHVDQTPVDLYLVTETWFDGEHLIVEKKKFYVLPDGSLSVSPRRIR